MSPSLALERRHCFGRYSSVDTFDQIPPRSMVIECGKALWLHVDQHVSALTSLRPSIALSGPSPACDAVAYAATGMMGHSARICWAGSAGRLLFGPAHAAPTSARRLTTFVSSKPFRLGGQLRMND